MSNIRGSTALFTSNLLVCIALMAVRHSSDHAATRTFYLLAANGLAGLLGFLPLRNENTIAFDGPTLAIVLWSWCYCAEYGLFLVYPGVISLSQLIVFNSMAPYVAVYLSRDMRRTVLGVGYRLLSIAPVTFLLGISYIERRASTRTSNGHALLILSLVFISIVISQSCARYVARNRQPTWSQPRLTFLNAVFLTLVLSTFLHYRKETLERPVAIALFIALGIMVLLIQRLYVFGLRKADPFISAMTLCTIVPLSLATEFMVENRVVGVTETVLAIGYILASAGTVRMSAQFSDQVRTELGVK